MSHFLYPNGPYHSKRCRSPEKVQVYSRLGDHDEHCIGTTNVRRLQSHQRVRLWCWYLWCGRQESPRSIWFDDSWSYGGLLNWWWWRSRLGFGSCLDLVHRNRGQHGVNGNWLVNAVGWIIFVNPTTHRAPVRNWNTHVLDKCQCLRCVNPEGGVWPMSEQSCCVIKQLWVCSINDNSHDIVVDVSNLVDHRNWYIVIPVCGEK